VAESPELTTRAGVPARVNVGQHVYWSDEPRRTRIVVGLCAACARSYLGVAWLDYDVVAPSGMAHCGTSEGTTLCGRDATGPEWWWAE